MMHTMVLGRVKDQFERPEIVDNGGMYPQLIDQIELVMCDVMRRRNEERQR